MGCMVTETRYFRSTVEQRGNRNPRLLHTMIRFSLRKVTRSCWAEAPTVIINGPVNHIGFGLSSVRLSDMKRFSERRKYTQSMAASLPHFPACVSQKMSMQLLLKKYFRWLKWPVFPDIPIFVCVWDVTIRFLDSATSLFGPGELARYLCRTRTIYDHEAHEDEDSRLMIIDRETYYEPKLIPATKSCIDGLEKVRFDSLETAIRQMPCAICRERLDHFAVEEGLMIARLPCSHLYHGDCIVQWLESNHLCPLCRYQMPTVEVEMEPPEPSRPPLHWNVLMMSVGGVLTAAACFALQMIEAKLKVKTSDRLLYVVPLVAIFSSKLL